ncbi:rRNA maturation RNase YbeY [Sphingomicrobium lutaoense]|uniref:Endoribonuclease YbeY n=1 Tax=Sphingomicrobium lutaoense TaxID=515949 RepID=A0A839Z3R6_9SPHN|nr:rRNA maturation RNase YbeY [Sphingomicrobium lutaoense]MBB3763234.1 putative rRNA maturation factor [Sphingomicrobium lutaoense]
MTIELALDTDPEWDSSGGPWADIARRAVVAALRESEYEAIITSPREVELSIRLSSDEEVRALNAQWRNKDRPTNVLSFPMIDREQLADAADEGPMLLLGDMILAFETCKREAAEKGVTFTEHATHLMVHGMLHLMGHDHMDEEEAADMEAREVKALERLDIANPYTLTAEAH